MNRKHVQISVLAMVMFSLSLANAKAATLSVPQSYGTISAAIKAANDGDVVMVSPGTYRENLNVRKNIEIRAVSSNQRDTLIDGMGLGSVVSFAGVKFDGVREPALSGFTITGGKAGSGAGGGVTIFNADAVVENNTIQFNSSSMDAGGILVFMNSNATIRNNFIDSNSATRYGAGIYVVTNSNPLIYGNRISNNNASGPSSGGSGAGGGGIYVDDNSSPQIIKNTITSNHADHAGGGIALRVKNNSIIEDNTITSNNAAYGGGIHIETQGGSPIIRNNIISSNQANQSGTFAGSGNGGGISVYNTSYPQIIGNEISNNFATQGGGGIVNAENASSTITGNKIFSNKVTTSSGSFTGGGIYVAASSATVNNNVIYANQAMIGGGIGLLDGANVNIQNNTIVKNIVTTYGGGISVLNGVSSSLIKNNIITQNGNFQVFEEHRKSVLRNNLINNDGKGVYFNWDIGINGYTDVNTLNSSGSADAKGTLSGSESFVDGSSNNYNIQNNSAAVDNGDNDIISKYDVDYNLRPFGSSVDIGAYEYTTVTRKTKPIYRFWSDSKQHHFFTINPSERDAVLNTYKVAEWKYEGQAFRAFSLADCGSASPVYRFWSNSKQGHFYTINQAERDHVISSYADDVWHYEGPAYCAETSPNGSNTALHRFWSDTKQGHFYTADSSEKTYIQNNYPSNVWKYESVAFYVYPNL